MIDGVRGGTGEMTPAGETELFKETICTATRTITTPTKNILGCNSGPPPPLISWYLDVRNMAWLQRVCAHNSCFKSAIQYVVEHFHTVVFYKYNRTEVISATISDLD
jgi:hypothetical protein